MALAWSLAQVQELARDASSAAAGRKLASPSRWRQLGHSERALWGECQGSALYQTRVALADFATSCSCPSRKFPCKHALGLLFLGAQSPTQVPALPEPEWVQSWLESRASAQQKKARAASAKPVDEVAQAKRAEKRHGSILAGLDQLDAWLADLIRQGLSKAKAESFSFWDGQARRLIDAQAPGLASRVRAMGGRVAATEDWSARLLDDLGTLALLSHAYRRLAELDRGLAADVKRSIGITLDQSEVLAHGDVVEDLWHVVSVVVEDDDRLRAQRAWLHGAESGRSALILQFAAGDAGFPEAFVTGTRLRARLAFWPSAAPQRAFVTERLSPPEPAPAAPRGSTIAAALDRFAAAVGRVPWLERDLFVLDSIVPEPGPTTSIIDQAGHVLPLYGQDHELLLALSGGHPVALTAEWDGYGLLPLAAWQGERFWQVARGHG